MKSAVLVVLDSGVAAVGLLCYIQQCFPVADFPPTDHPAYRELAHAMRFDDEFQGSFQGNFNLKAALDKAAEVDLKTKRIRMRPGGVEGRFLGERFPSLAHSLFRLALEIRGLVTFG
ncbi:MAG TPA: hypothetical protein VMA75_01500 [Candidatus Paceibacterota bacterium]|nr:hypothetical protein [Candidatus Paceibacterota bacterium]